MIRYNTQEPRLSIREYGRHIQKLIEHIPTIENREERTKCAERVAEIMTRLFPELAADPEGRKVWDHMNIISGFNLDIDFPCDVLKENEMRPKPAAIPYSKKNEAFRSYGKNIVDMIREVSRMEAGTEKDQAIFLIANQMKKLLINENADSATDNRVFKDIKAISGGTIDIDPTTYKLNEYIGVNAPNEGKKKKKK